jgi:hypothetical protein
MGQLMPQTLDPDSIRRLLTRAAKQIRALTQPVFDQLAQLEQSVSSVDVDDWAGSPQTLAAWPQLESSVGRALESVDLMTGAGLAVASASAGGARQSAFAWWVRRDGIVRLKQHVLNPSSDSYYDFTQSRWFRLPTTVGQPVLMAPYVDSWGTDDVTMTASQAVRAAGETVAVVAADLDVHSYVDKVEHILASAVATALVDSEDRVIASNAPDIESGTRLAAARQRAIVVRVPIESLGWSVVALGEPLATAD